MGKTMQATMTGVAKSIIVFITIVVISYSGSVLPNDAVEETPPQDQDWSVWSESEFRRSDNPLLWLNDENVQPIVPPEPSSVPMAEVPTDTVEFDPVTKEEIVIPEVPSPERLNSEGFSIPPYEGLLPMMPLELPESVLGTDDRSQILNTTTFPWRTIARLRIKYPESSSIWGCSGAIIDNFHILTAGHCVHNGTDWAEWIEVYPGQDESYAPYHKAWVTNIRSYTGWTVDQNPEHDWSVVTLDRNIGNYTGWMGRQTASSFNSIYTGILNVSGYPCDKPDGSHWWDGDSGHSATGYRHFYYMDTYGCQSGSPVWRYVDPDRYIVSIHAYGDSSGTPGVTNGGTRLNQDKYDRIITWLNEDSSSPPIDKPDLIDDGDDYSGFSTTSAYSGDSFSAYSSVRNVGTLNSNGFYVTYYASTNTTITATDRLLGSAWVSGVNAFDWDNAEWSGSLPGDIPPGNYYIGWIIDSTGTNSEFDESNNIAYKANPKLTVLQVTAPSSITASDGTYTNKVAVSWNSSSGATSYQLYRCATSSTGSCGSAIYSGSNTSRDDTGATPGITYYYRVQACNGAGCSSYSSYDSGKRAVTSPSVTTNAASGITQISAKLNATINPKGVSTTAKFEYGTTSSYGSTTSSSTLSGTTNQSFSRNISGLNCGTTYHFRAVGTNAGGTTYGSDRAFTTTACDNVNPSLTITVPAGNETIPNNQDSYAFSGTANDSDGTISQVQYRRNSSSWQNASGTNNWSFTVTGLTVGNNVIEVRARDNQGDYSTIASRTINRAAATAKTLTVSKSGAGAGTITSNPAGINCGSDCSEGYDNNTVVTLTATPDSNSTFSGWSGTCNGTGTCQITMNADKTVTAIFTANSDKPANIGVFRSGRWYLDANGDDRWNNCQQDHCLSFGQANDQPFAGDWNNDGYDEVGVKRGRVWYLDNGSGQWSGCGNLPSKDLCSQFGWAGDQAVVGDWNGDGYDEIGVHRGKKWYLDHNGNNVWNYGDTIYTFGNPGDQPIVGDWNGDDFDEIGVKRGNKWYLDYDGNGRWNKNADKTYTFGKPGDQPIVDDWDGDGRDNIGVKRGSKWYLDFNGNGMWDKGVDAITSFGRPNAKPVSGNWKE